MKKMTEIKRRHIQAKNYGYGKKNTPKYIVIHYTANPGTSAEQNAKYFATTSNKVSAHFIVDEKEIIQCVQPHYPAWHCGGSVWEGTNPTHNGKCFNSNSIGIEMCCEYDKGEWYFEKETVLKTSELVKALIKDYNIPIENVIRHYDVTGKPCPEPYLIESYWETFKLESDPNRQATQERFGFDDNTMAFLDDHPYVDALYMKLATYK